MGSLPGPKDEQDVAVLPEERATETTTIDRPEDQPGDPTDNKKDTSSMGVGIGGATDPLKRDTQFRVSSGPCICYQLYACHYRKAAQRSGHLDDPTIQLEPRVHPLGGDRSRWRGLNFGRSGMEKWERAAALTDVFILLCFAILRSSLAY